MISTTFMQKVTVEDIITDSVKETKLEKQTAPITHYKGNTIK